MEPFRRTYINPPFLPPHNIILIINIIILIININVITTHTHPRLCYYFDEDSVGYGGGGDDKNLLVVDYPGLGDNGDNGGGMVIMVIMVMMVTITCCMTCICCWAAARFSSKPAFSPAPN